MHKHTQMKKEEEEEIEKYGFQTTSNNFEPSIPFCYFSTIKMSHIL